MLTTAEKIRQNLNAQGISSQAPQFQVGQLDADGLSRWNGTAWEHTPEGAAVAEKQQAEHEAYWQNKLAAEQKQKKDAWYAQLDQQKGFAPGTHAAFNTMNNGLIKVADLAADAGIVKGAMNSVYKNFAPPGSKYYKSR